VNQNILFPADQKNFQEFIDAFYNQTKIVTYLVRTGAVICAVFLFFSWIKNTVTYKS